MRTSIKGLVALSLLSIAAPALAQDEASPPGDITITGGVTLVSDYRFRGVSQSAEDVAIQGTINVNHSSGLYFGTWASSIDEDTIAYGHTEVDLYAGWTGEVASGVTGDIGVIYYVYPNAPSGTASDYFEVYGSVKGTLGPASVKVGTNYAWSQNSTFNDDNLYLYTDVTIGIPDSPVTLVGHFGYSDGSFAQYNNFFSGAPFDGEYTDWAVGFDVALAPVTLGVRYVDTDLGTLTFGSTRDLADGALMFSIGAAF